MLRSKSFFPKSFFLAALLLLLPAVSALAVGQGRLQATVVDENGAPIADMKVTVTQGDIGYDNTFTTNKKGVVTIAVVDATRPYVFQFEKEGYRPTQEQVKFDAGGLMREQYTVPSVGAVGQAPSAEETQRVEGHNKAVKAYNEGVVGVQSGDTAVAKEAFLRAIEIDAEMTQPYSALADIYIAEESYAQAVEMADKLLALQPGNARALQVLYDAHNALGNTAEAKAALDQLSAMEDGGSGAAVRVFNMGAEAIRAGDLDTARGHFEKAAELDPELAPAHAALAGIYLDAGDNEKALTAAETALSIDPDLQQVQKVRYEAYRRMGDDAKAKEVFAEMAEGDPEGLAQALFNNGKAAFESGDSAAAKLAFEQALEADPSNARTHYMLGLVLVNLGDGAQAKQHFQKFIEMAPDDPEVANAKEMLQYTG